MLNQQTKEGYHQVSQELRIASPQGETLEWLGGVYAQYDHVAGTPGNTTYFFDNAAFAKAYPTLANYLPLATDIAYEQAEHSYAAFGSLDWNITDQLKVGAGLRGTWDYKSASQNSLYGTGTSTYGSVVSLPTAALQATAAKALQAQRPLWFASNSYNSAMPSAEIDYKIVPAVMVYATYSKGFLAGNPTDVGYVLNGVVTPPVLPEHVNAYEAGLKSKFFNDHMLLNLDVFRSNYTNLQVGSNTYNAAGTAVAEITNAGSSRSQGVEFSGEWVQNGFRLKSAVTYLNARYIHYTGVGDTQAQTYCRVAANIKDPSCLAEFPNGEPAATQDLSGQPTSFAPTWSGSMTASYTAALPRGYHFITETDVYATTNYFFGNTGTDDPTLLQSGYARLDGRLSFESPSESWAIDIILKNLTDKIIFMGAAGGTGLPATTGSTLLQIDQPRNVAIQARYQW